jgi:coenzyme F420 hydrogenase subunit delta
MRSTDQSDLPEYCQKSTLVLGCGNILFGDDGFGCALVEYVLSHHGAPEDVCMLDAGTGVRKLLFTLCLSPVRPRRLLIVDALDAGHPIGELFEIDPADIPEIKMDDFSMHQMPTSNLLRELQEACGVEVRVLACQTGPLPQEICPGLSSPVQAALPRAASWLVREYLPNDGRQPRGQLNEPGNRESFRPVACTERGTPADDRASCNN